MKLFGKTTHQALLTAFLLVFVASVATVASPLVTQAQQKPANIEEEDEEDTAPSKGGAQPAIAWDAKRLLKLDRNVRKLERTVARIENKPNPPMLIEPDPEVVALQAIVDTLSRRQKETNAALVAQTAQFEQAQNQIRILTQQNQALTARLDTLTRRLDLMSAQVKDIETAIAPPPPPPPSTGSAEQDFDRAYGLMVNNDIDGAIRAFESFIDTWPEAQSRAEAWYRLGLLRQKTKDPNGALTAYASALKGWPKTVWAPDATVKMAQVLLETNRPKDTCAALVQFDKLYIKTSAAESRALSKELKSKAKC